MTIYNFLFFVLISNLACSQDIQNKNAIDFFNLKIETVESLLINGTSNNEHLNAIKYLEKLTQIQPCYQYGIEQEPDRYITSFIISDWKDWLNLNKEVIYLKHNSDSIEFKKSRKFLIKDPQKEFLKYLNILKSNSLGEFQNLDELYCIYDFFAILTPYDWPDLEFNEEWDFVLPTKDYIKKITGWYEQNHERLIWEPEEQKVFIKN